MLPTPLRISFFFFQSDLFNMFISNYLHKYDVSNMSKLAYSP